MFAAIWDERRPEPDAADRVIEAKGLKQISDTGALEKIVEAWLGENEGENSPVVRMKEDIIDNAKRHNFCKRAPKVRSMIAVSLT